MATAILWLPAAQTSARTPLVNNPALLNIGFVCKWQTKCMSRQERAMRASLGYVKKQRPPAWKIEVCNRNAARNGTRKDWIGFNNCIRNTAIRPSLVTSRKKRR